MGCASSSSGKVQHYSFDQVKEWRDQVVAYREQMAARLKGSGALKSNRDDVFCTALPTPWKPLDQGNYDVGDLFHSAFKKSSTEINIGFKGG